MQIYNIYLSIYIISICQLLLRPRGRLDDDTGRERHGARAGAALYLYRKVGP